MLWQVHDRKQGWRCRYKYAYTKFANWSIWQSSAPLGVWLYSKDKCYADLFQRCARYRDQIYITEAHTKQSKNQLQHMQGTELPICVVIAAVFQMTGTVYNINAAFWSTKWSTLYSMLCDWPLHSQNPDRIDKSEPDKSLTQAAGTGCVQASLFFFFHGCWFNRLLM